MEFKNATAMWRNAVHHALHGLALDSRDGASTEFIGWSGRFNTWSGQTLCVDPCRRIDPVYAAAEVLWYLTGSNSIEMIKAYAPQYERFAEGGVAYGAYGFRFRNDPGFTMELKTQPRGLVGKAVSTQISSVITLLQEKPNTRQAVITMWNGGDLLHAIIGDHKDLPCTLSLQFLLRGRLLHCIATMRSNDVWLGLPYDVFAFTCLQRLIADALKVKTGMYVHQVGSLHVYERNRNKINLDMMSDTEVMSLANNMTSKDCWHAPAIPISTAAQLACDLEYRIRTGVITNVGFDQVAGLGVGTLLCDLVLLCASKWTPTDLSLLHNPYLRMAYNAKFREARL